MSYQGGQIQQFLLDSRPGQIQFQQDNYLNSYDYGNFPDAIWKTGYNFDYCSFGAAALNGSQWLLPQMYACDFSYANMTNSTFGSPDRSTGLDAQLVYSSLAYADCSGSTFYGNDNPNSSPDWIQNDCTGTIFRYCTFIGMNFQGGGFIGADFTGAQFIRCRWTTYEVQGSPPSYSTDGTIYWDGTTIWPDGFDTSVFPGSAHKYLDYSNQTLTNVDIGDKFYGHANFENAVLHNVTFGYNAAFANFQNAQLLGTTLNNTYFTVCWGNFRGAVFDLGPADPSRSNAVEFFMAAHADFTGLKCIWPLQQQAEFAAFNNTNFAYAIFDGMTMPPGVLAYFDGCNCAHASFVGATIGPTDHFPMDFRTQQRFFPDYAFGDSNFSYCDFTGCQGGWFQASVMSYAKFNNANMPYTDFNEAYIGDADFTGAKITPNAFYGTMTETGNFVDFGEATGITAYWPNWNSQISIYQEQLYGGVGYHNDSPWTIIAFVFTSVDPGTCTPNLTQGVFGASFRRLAVYNNAASGGRGWLSVWQAVFPGNPVGNVGTLYWDTDLPSGTFWGATYITFSLDTTVRNLQFTSGTVTKPNQVIQAPTVPAKPIQNGMFNVAAFFSLPPRNSLYATGGGLMFGPGGVSVPGQGQPDQNRTEWWEGSGYYSQNDIGPFGGAFVAVSFAPTDRPGIFYAATTAQGDFSANAGGVPSYVAVSLAVDKVPFIPAFYNPGTVLPAGVATGPATHPPWIPACWQALTSQTDFMEVWTDGHQDFSGQTIDPNANNYPTSYGPFLQAYGADFNKAHFVGELYENLYTYNCNFQDATFDRGFGFMYGNNGAYRTSYLGHWGTNSTGAFIPRSGLAGIAGPTTAWRVP